MQFNDQTNNVLVAYAACRRRYASNDRWARLEAATTTAATPAASTVATAANFPHGPSHTDQGCVRKHAITTVPSGRLRA